LNHGEAMHLKEKLSVDYTDLSYDFFKIVDEQNKDHHVISCLNNLPMGEARQNILKFINTSDKEILKDLVSILQTKNCVYDITLEDYKYGVSSLLFDLSHQGTGRGEIYLAWVLNGAKINGTNNNTSGWDLMDKNGCKYEVKEIMNSNNSLRLGTDSLIINSKLWINLKNTIDVVCNITEDELCFINNEDLRKIVIVLKEQEQIIRRGELCNHRIQSFVEFFKIAHDIVKNNKCIDYSMFEMKGVGLDTVSGRIESLEYVNGLYHVKIANGGMDMLKNIMARLWTLDYVKNPLEFSMHQEDLLDSQVKNADYTYFIFTPQGPVIISPKDLEYDRITQAKLKVKIPNWVFNKKGKTVTLSNEYYEYIKEKRPKNNISWIPKNIKTLVI
jgi:hypothetical protein